MNLTRLLPAVFLAVLVGLPSALANPAEIIRKARAHVGPENTLNSLRSIHYIGTLSVNEPDENGVMQPVNVAIEIIFQRPFQQRIVATSPNKIEVTALNDYEAWQREQDPDDPANWRMTLLAADQIKRLRANTWENLAFYSGLERRGGRIEDHGRVQFEGTDAHKLTFVHDRDIAFTRYFDRSTGRLLMTETESGSTIREEGEIRSGGLRFPRRLVTSNLLEDGTRREITVTFDRVEVNKTFDESEFAVPIMGMR